MCILFRVTTLWLALLAFSMPLRAATLFFDDFNGNAIDQSVWRLPTGPGTYFGRTQIKPPSYFGQDTRPQVSGGTVVLQLDTYNPSGPGSFWGQEIQTYQTFEPGSTGLSISTRMRFLDTPAPGLVAGFFTWGYDGTIRDEIDVELLTNDLHGIRYLTNVYNDATFSNGGDAAFVYTPGYMNYSMLDWNTYEIRWLPDRIQWLINGVQVRERLGAVNGHPSEVRLNLWAPDSDFVAAYNAGLQGALVPADNQQYRLEVDYVKVSSVPLPSAIWLMLSAVTGLGVLARRRAALRS